MPFGRYAEEALLVPHIVVVGAGFAGLTVVQQLRRAPVRITLIDRRNHHLFQPLLYQVATAALAPGDIAEPIRRIVERQANVSVRLGEVSHIDVQSQRVHLGDEHIPYDTLVLATGATHHYFGNDAWAAHAPGLKTIGDALAIRRRVLSAYEQAEWTTDPTQRATLLTFVVIGAGPTGVELAGALKQIATYTLKREFRKIDPAADTRVVLIEAGPAVLGGFTQPLPARARQQLEGLGVQVLTGAPVEEVDEGGVRVGGTRIDAGTVLWAAGVKASPLGACLGAPLDRSGRVQIAPDLSVPGHNNVYVIGDLAHFTQDGAPLPGVAPVAIQQAKHVARSLRRGLRGRPPEPFRYRDYGSMATIGRSRAIAEIGPLRLHGFIAWLMWVFIHLMTLVGHRNRLIVFVKWAWAWLTWEASSRLIWRDDEGTARERPTTQPPTEGRTKPQDGPRHHDSDPPG